MVKIFFTKVGKKWAIKLTSVVFWENSNAKIGYKFNILKDNAISQKMQYAKLNKFQLELMGNLQWDFFLERRKYLLVYCGLLKTDPRISRIEKIMYEMCPNFVQNLSTYTRVYTVLSIFRY